MILLTVPSLRAMALTRFVKRVNYVCDDSKSEAGLMWFVLTALRRARGEATSYPGNGRNGDSNPDGSVYSNKLVISHHSSAMLALVAGVHVFFSATLCNKTWMAGDKSGHDAVEEQFKMTGSRRGDLIQN
jgi:hypothetical protein